MNRVLVGAVLMFMCMHNVFSDVALKGTVTKNGATAGLSGVKVSLLGQPTLADITDVEGNFLITDGVANRVQRASTTSFGITFKNNMVIISSDEVYSEGSIGIFNASGRRIRSTTFGDLQSTDGSIALSDLAAGVYLLKISCAGTVITHTFACIGNDLIMKDTRAERGSTSIFSLQKRTAATAVDTLLAEKNGYVSKKIPLTSYQQDSIAVMLDSSGGASGGCTREALDAIAETYVKALEAGDPELMDLGEDAKYVENMKASAFNNGIWKSTLQVTHHRNIIDVDSCRAFVEVIDHKSATPYIIGAQLSISGGKISQISALVSTVGDWLLSSKNDITNAYNKSSGEDWSIIPQAQHNNRETIQAAGDAYLDAFLDSTKVTVPWGRPCARLEGGAYTGDGPNSTCNVGVPQGLEITDRSYVVDIEMGTVDIFCKFGGSMPDSHLFRIIDGKLRYVHTISIQSKK